MSLVTTVGGAQSNSFETLSNMETFLTSIFGTLVTTWSSLTTAQKEFQAEMAADWIGYLPLRGRRAYRNQGLAFPRTCQLDSSVMPDRVKEAQALMLYEVVHRAWNIEEDSLEEGAEQVGSVKSVSLGVLSVSFGDSISSGNPGVLLKIIQSGHPAIYSRLKPYIATIRGGKLRTAAERAIDTLALRTTTTI